MRRFYTKFMILTALLALAGFGCSGKNPEQVVEGAKKALIGQSQFAYQFHFSGDPAALDEKTHSSLRAALPTAESVVFMLNGQVDRTQEDDGLLDQQGEFLLQVEAEESFELNGGYLSVDGVNYLRLANADFGSIDLGSFDLSTLLNRWIELPGSFADGTDPSRIMAGSASDDEWTDEQVEAAVKAFSDFSLFRSATKAGEEEVRGVKTVEYAVELDEAGIQLFAEAMARIQGEDFSSADQQEIQNQVSRINSGNPHLWVGEADGLPYRIAFTVSKIEGANEGQVATVTLEFFDYGKTKAVVAPEDAVSMEEAFSGLFEDAFGQMFTPPSNPTQGMNFGTAEDYLQSLQGGELFDPAELEKAMKAMQGL